MIERCIYCTLCLRTLLVVIGLNAGMLLLGHGSKHMWWPLVLMNVGIGMVAIAKLLELRLQRRK